MSTNPYETPQEKDISRTESSGDWMTVLLKAGVAALFVFVLFFTFVPVRFTPREVTRRISCSNNLRQIALALQSYQDDFGRYPPAYTVDANGKPLHSWRTLVLPYLEQKALYDTINLSKPWDDPVNAAAMNTSLEVYQCQSSFPRGKGGNLTTYLASVGPEAAIHPKWSRKPSEFIDGTSLTLLLIEVPKNHAVPWMSPKDADMGMIVGIRPDAKLGHKRGMNVAFVDGHVQYLPADALYGERRGMITIAGGE